MKEHLSHDTGSSEAVPFEHTNLSRAIPETVPAWYKPQPFSPHQVYDADTIRDIQRTLSVPQTGLMDDNTINHIKGLQHALGMPGTGRIDLETAQAIQRLRDRYAIRE